MFYPIDMILYNNLAQRVPEEVCKRSGCKYDEMETAFVLASWSDIYIFDRALAGYLAADAVFALAVDACERISGV